MRPDPDIWSMYAFVAEAETRTGVAGLRGLGRADIPTLALGPRWTAPGMWSRHAWRRAVVPAPQDDPGGFTRGVARLARARGGAVPFCAGEASLGALLERHDELPSDLVLPYPGPAPVQALRDKARLPALAAAAGLLTPRTFASGRPSEIRAASLPEPVVVKPARPGGALGSARVVPTSPELDALLDSLPPTEPIIVQEKVQGPLGAVSVVLDRDGCVVARFQQSASATWPANAGASTIAVSVAPESDLVARVARMLRLTGYWGLAQVQFLRAADGPVVIDVNPRLFGSLPLALACGVNLPAAWHAVTLARPARDSDTYAVGVTYRWLEGDISAAAAGELYRLAHRAPRPAVGAMWAADDPAASLLLAMRAASVRARRRIGRR